MAYCYSTRVTRCKAMHGAAGPASVLEGKFGLYHAFVGAEEGTIDIDGQLADLGSRWETPRIAYKPYPACHYVHGVLGAAEQATGGQALTADEIAEVVVTVPEASVPIVLEPAAAKAVPRTEYEGKFSLPYSAAAMLVHGSVGVATYTEKAIGVNCPAANAAPVRPQRMIPVMMPGSA